MACSVYAMDDEIQHLMVDDGRGMVSPSASENARYDMEMPHVYETNEILKSLIQTKKGRIFLVNCRGREINKCLGVSRYKGFRIIETSSINNTWLAVQEIRNNFDFEIDTHKSLLELLGEEIALVEKFLICSISPEASWAFQIQRRNDLYLLKRMLEEDQEPSMPIFISRIDAIFRPIDRVWPPVGGSAALKDSTPSAYRILKHALAIRKRTIDSHDEPAETSD